MADARDRADEIRDTVREELRMIGLDVRERLPVVVMGRRTYLRTVESRLSQGADIALSYGFNPFEEKTERVSRPQLRLIRGGLG